MDEFETPMMLQYKEIKREHSDCLLLFRLGDFYELFMEDAEIGAKVLDITLTSRDRGKDGRIPMAGVPYHALDSYLYKLIKAGYKVAICEQVSDPSAGKLVEREVVRIITPGTLLDSKALDNKQNNYIVSISLEASTIGFAFADLSTGEFVAAQYAYDDVSQIINQEITRFNPSECILATNLYNDPVFLKKLTIHKGLNIYPFHNWVLFASDESSARRTIQEHFELATLHAFSIQEEPESLKASAALLEYLKHTQKGKVKHIKNIKRYSSEDHVELDRATIINLELFSTLRSNQKVGSLINVLDKTSTSMGARYLRALMVHPLHDREDIEHRYEAISYLLDNRFQKEDLRGKLEKVADLERILSRLSVGLGNARDLINLKNSLLQVNSIKEILQTIESAPVIIQEILGLFDDQYRLPLGVIEKFISEEPPVETREGGLIKEGINERLDTLKESIQGSKTWLAHLENEEKKKTGINSLKVRFNKVFGYYIEVSKSNLELVPNTYIRKQTLVNAERFFTPELKTQEELVLSADEEIKELEYKILLEVIDEVLKYTHLLQQLAKGIALLDVLVCFADIAEKYHYCRPQIATSHKLEIKDGRHPVVELLIENNQFVPNDVTLDDKENQLLIITGPNMAGKSVFIRQVALIVLMAHMGCFVPANKAKIALVDRLFVRSGASDVISEGLSTFMVEMVETAYILNHATRDSLIIMDEIGRGTSTYDGISIASAIAEFLVSNYPGGGPKTLFATHYHELQALEDKYTSIKNFQVVVKHENGEPVFIHKVLAGGASHSFGVSVAKLAGVPETVVKRATSILAKLEHAKDAEKPNVDIEAKKMVSIEKENKQDLENLQKISEELKLVDVNNTSPLEALRIIDYLKNLVN